MGGPEALDVPEEEGHVLAGLLAAHVEQDSRLIEAEALVQEPLSPWAKAGMASARPRRAATMVKIRTIFFLNPADGSSG